MRRLTNCAIAISCAFAVSPLTASTTEPLKASALEKMLKDKKWEMKWAACMGAPPCRAYWDWMANGTVCARAVDAKRDERCADEGRWHLKGNNLCWELTWFGTGAGFKKSCVTVEPSGAGQYTAIRVGGFGTPFFRFSVARDL